MNRYQLPRFLLFLLFLLLLIAGLCFWKFFQAEPLPMTPHQRTAAYHRASLLQQGTELPPLKNISLKMLDEEFTDLVAHVLPSVVSITTTDMPSRETLLRQFFGLSGRPPLSSNKMGSGMIVSAKGHVITNWHVVKDAIEATVQLEDGRSLPARLIGFDERADIAVLKIEADDLTPITFGDSDHVKVGQSVLAIGNPFGLQETVTEGIISAKGRRAMSEAANEFFQTSASINPGNSGGPLVSIDGEVVGINNFIISRSGGAEGLGFAIPSNVARRVYNDIIKHGHVIRPWFGVVLRPLNASLARQLGLHDTTGALVAATLPDSPAEHAHLELGDVITSFNGRDIKDWMDLRNRVAETQAGDNVHLSVLRQGHPLHVSVTIQEEPK